MHLDHFIALADVPAGAFVGLLELSARVKRSPHYYRSALSGRTLAMIFQKSSTRTRVSFEVAMAQLGGYGLFLSSRDLQLARGESISDTAQVLSRYCDGLVARTFGHEDVVALHEHATVPVINGLTDLNHPCQALADFLTILERFGSLTDSKLCYVGDGNNVAYSLIAAAALVGSPIAIVAPEGFEPDAGIVRWAAERLGEKLQVTQDLAQGLADARVVYTDVWTSMGQEEEAERRRAVFASFQVNQAGMAQAAPDAIFMHCLPAHRGEEVTAGVIDGPQSVVFEQAENRLHTQKAVLLATMGSLA